MTAPPEEDLQVISSSSDEDAARGAPSQRTAEEEDCSSRGGRREPRSKAAHDRDAAATRGAPREEAGAPPEGARAISPQLSKAKKRVWKMADE